MFRPSLSYHLSLRSLFCLFLSGRFTQVLLHLLNSLKISFYCRLLTFSKLTSFLKKIFHGLYQKVNVQYICPDLVQTVCKGYQQTKNKSPLSRKELSQSECGKQVQIRRFLLTCRLYTAGHTIITYEYSSALGSQVDFFKRLRIAIIRMWDGFQEVNTVFSIFYHYLCNWMVEEFISIIQNLGQWS